MQRSHLMIVCGIPGAGKSTFALRMADRWGAVSFASETFAEQLGDPARTKSGDLSKEAILHAYAAMGAAVTHSLAANKLVVAVGSFRSEEQRSRFRDIATNFGASVTTVRINCSINTATQRIQSRRAIGERGPNEEAIIQINGTLDRATDVEVVLTNESTFEEFYRKIDALIQGLNAIPNVESAATIYGT